MPKVTVYVRAAEWRRLEGRGTDPALWVRGVVAEALTNGVGGEVRRERESLAVVDPSLSSAGVERVLAADHFRPDPKK